MSKKKNTDSKLQGINRITVDATIELTDLVENMHKRIVHPPFLPSTPVQHLITNIAGVVYKNIRWGTKLMGNGADRALRQFAPYISDIKSTEKREGIRSVLNGLVGDYLKRTDNPLQIEMQFKNNGKNINLTKKGISRISPKVGSSILLMIHGSCLNDQNWSHNKHNHGAVLAKDFNKTPVYLKYNSGLHVSENGQQLNTFLKKLFSKWPVPVEEIRVIAHSMGGLVLRSALYYGQKENQVWTKSTKQIFFLGTPHQGAPLEKAGNYVEVLLNTIPYAKPFARLAKIRGAGVTDLRYGNLLDEDWQDIDQHKIKGDNRTHVPLPVNIDCYTIAAVTSKETTKRMKLLQSDGMVDLKSALGRHKKSSKNLKFQKEKTLVVYGCNHVELLSNQEVFVQLQKWFVN
ncbi:permease [Patiriisocius marinistellae]|uniref:Permease n=1 Tax=Patiriisocius marinistellae TaxID=2494560 RepID=A0A5J4FX56_9FLAO|nr:alpha/beta hydrolase [Patiriisocius marinistellae]GEQ84659.1 permease [Patiriisocius marinistellae]